MQNMCHTFITKPGWTNQQPEFMETFAAFSRFVIISLSLEHASRNRTELEKLYRNRERV